MNSLSNKVCSGSAPMLNVTLKPFSPLDDILDEVIYYEKQKK